MIEKTDSGVCGDLSHYTLVLNPFTLTHDDIHLEAPQGLIYPANEDVKFLAEETTPEEFDRILRAYVIARVNRPMWTLGQCLRTAIVWERG